MKTTRSLLILFLVITVTLLTVSSAQTTMSEEEAITAIKESLSNQKYFGLRGIEFKDDGFKIYSTFSMKGNSIDREIDYSYINSPDLIVGRTFVVDFPPSKHWLTFDNMASAQKFVSAVYSLKHTPPEERQRKRDDCLRGIRSTPVNTILSGATVDDLTIPCKVKMEAVETILNEILIEWKSKGLPVLLQKSSPSQLSDWGIKLEKAMLKLDLKAKELKDAADADARQAKNPAGTLTIAHLIDQRKTILMVILGSVKQAAAQKASGG